MTYTDQVRTFQQLRPCIAPGAHKFVVAHPPAGQWGNTEICCERCGMTRSEATL